MYPKVAVFEQGSRGKCEMFTNKGNILYGNIKALEVNQQKKGIENMSICRCEGDAADKATIIDYSKTGANKR